MIAKGFLFEKGDSSFVGKPLPKEHPFLSIDNVYTDSLTIAKKKYNLKINPKSINQLIEDSTYCQQKLVEVYLTLPEKDFQEGSLRIKKIKDKIISFYQPTFGKAVFIKEGIATIEDLKNYLKTK